MVSFLINEVTVFLASLQVYLKTIEREKWAGRFSPMK